VGERPQHSVLRGAGSTAPTAPHATPARNQAERRTGPARFWSAERIRQGLAGGFVVSLALHYVISPFSVMPSGPEIKFHEQTGDLSIPVEFIGIEGEQPSQKTNPKNGNGGNGAEGATDAAVKNADDASAGSDAGADASEEQDGGADDGGGLIAVADGGGGRDPNSLLGAAASVSAGPNNITIMVNFVELRKHPEGANLGRVLAGIPQWRTFMSNAQGSAMLDPMRDCDWMIIMGPSLLDTQNDAVFLHYSVPDATVDKVIDTVSKTYPKGGPVNLGVPGVKGWKGFADKGERVFIRPRPHIAVVVPSSKAQAFARVLVSNPVTPHVRAGEAFSLRALRPGGSINVIPQDISELRMWIVPRASDGGGDLYAEGDCPNDAAAQANAEALKTLIRQKNSFGVRLLTAGFLNNVDVTASNSQVHLHINGTQAQIEALLHIAGGMVGITLASGAPPTATATSSAPATSSSAE
jgi:hypothetical protein